MKKLTQEKHTRLFETLPVWLAPIEITITVPPMSLCVVKKCFSDKVLFERDRDFDELLPQTLPRSHTVRVLECAPFTGTTFVKVARVGGRFTNLSQIEYIILQTESGKNTGVLTNGYPNFFFLDVGVAIFVPQASRDNARKKWIIYLSEFSPTREWRSPFRFISAVK